MYYKKGYIYLIIIISILLMTSCIKEKDNNKYNEKNEIYMNKDEKTINNKNILSNQKETTLEDMEEWDTNEFNLFGYLGKGFNNFIMIGGISNNKFYDIDDIKEKINTSSTKFYFYSIENIKIIEKYCHIKDNTLLVGNDLSKMTNDNLFFFMNNSDKHYSIPKEVPIRDISYDEYNMIITKIVKLLKSYDLDNVALKNIRFYEVNIDPHVDKERIITLSNLLFSYEQKDSTLLDHYNDIGAYSLMLYQRGDIINVIDKRITYLTRNDFINLTKEEELIEFEKQKNIYKRELENMVPEDQYIKGGQLDEGPYIYLKDEEKNEICVKAKTFVMNNDWSNYAKHCDYLPFMALDLNNDNYKEIIIQDDYSELDLHFRTIYIYNIRSGEPILEMKKILLPKYDTN